MNTLASLEADLLAAQQASPRSRQIATGASQADGCRAEAVLRLSGTPQTDPRFSWPAEVGQAVHDRFEAARSVRAFRLNEYRAYYQGVSATVDEFDLLDATLRDFKTKDDAAAINKVRRYGPDQAHVLQVHLGAAALACEGLIVRRVELVYVPRSGELSDGYVWSEPFNPVIGGMAVQLVQASDTLALTVETLDGLRDKESWWCRQFCPYVTACRGPQPPAPEVDDDVRQAAEEYLAAKADRDDAEQRMAMFRQALTAYPAVDVDGFTLRWSGGNVKVKQVEDVDAMRDFYLLANGEVPVRTVETVTARQLRESRRKP